MEKFYLEYEIREDTEGKQYIWIDTKATELFVSTNVNDEGVTVENGSAPEIWAYKPLKGEQK